MNYYAANAPAFTVCQEVKELKERGYALPLPTKTHWWFLSPQRWV